jgi:hypothetical protein
MSVGTDGSKDGEVDRSPASTDNRAYTSSNQNSLPNRIRKAIAAVRLSEMTARPGGSYLVFPLELAEEAARAFDTLTEVIRQLHERIPDETNGELEQLRRIDQAARALVEIVGSRKEWERCPEWQALTESLFDGRPDIKAVERPIATVRKTSAGPYLHICGVVVASGFGVNHDGAFEELADEVNKAFKRRRSPEEPTPEHTK